MTTDVEPLSPAQIKRLQRLLGTHRKKEKASISLSGELLLAADAVAGKSARSALVERALRRYLRVLMRRSRDELDRQLIDAHSATTNRESDAVLALQQWPE